MPAFLKPNRSIVGGVWLAGLSTGASADTLRVIDASVFLQEASDRVFFAVDLNRAPIWPVPAPDVLPAPPDMATLSDGAVVAAERDAMPAPESFQFFLDVAPEDESDTAFPWEVIVRGGEATTGSGIPFRDATPSEFSLDDPTSGGWGPVLGIADYQLASTNDGATITFSAPNAWVGISEAGVSYELMLLEDGAAVDKFVPTPTALLGGGLLLGWTALRRRGAEHTETAIHA